MEIEEVAQMLYELYADGCCCNYNDIDGWLPFKCQYSLDNSCPNPPDRLGCWKEFVKHWKEKKYDG